MKNVEGRDCTYQQTDSGCLSIDFYKWQILTLFFYLHLSQNV